jgi:hypothetical protein
LYSVGGTEDRVWAVGGTVDPRQGGRALAEVLVDDGWRTVVMPPVNSPWATLWSVNTSNEATWMVGNAFAVAKGDFDVLLMRGGEEDLARVNAPNPSPGVDILASVAAAGQTIWSVGHFSHGPRFPLIEARPPVDTETR